MDLLTRLRAAFHAFNHPEEAERNNDMATIHERLAALEAAQNADNALGEQITGLATRVTATESDVAALKADLGTDPAPEQQG